MILTCGPSYSDQPLDSKCFCAPSAVSATVSTAAIAATTVSAAATALAAGIIAAAHT